MSYIFRRTAILFLKNSLGQGLLRTSTSITNNVISEPLVRTRTTCSKLGKEKSVKTAMHRYFRVNKRIWIRAIPGELTIGLEQKRCVFELWRFFLMLSRISK